MGAHRRRDHVFSLLPFFRNQSGKQLYDKAGKLKKVSRAAVATDGRVFREGSTVAPEPERHWISLRDVVVVAIVMMLMLFALHCTWVTSNAYSRFPACFKLRWDEFLRFIIFIVLIGKKTK